MNQMSKKQKPGISPLVAAAAGVAVGAAAATFMDPKKRQKVAKTAQKVSAEVQEQGQKVADRVEEVKKQL